MTDPADPLALDLRAGLPEALQVLLADRPREGWRADPEFDGLVSFWLERHMAFRKLLGLMEEATAAHLHQGAPARDWAARISRFGGMFLQELHGHHMIEDQRYFPRLRALEPRLDRGFEILDRDHHALDGWMAAFADAANAGIGAATTPDVPAAALRDAAGGMEGALADMSRLLDRHLLDEEDLIVPVILKHGVKG
ncbi:hemerythrin domain-containing protein [Rhodovulum sp. DZ06]|uniref:hemerythrin domain-containing protein n=1 Tax=Rhodovulum sp. DZ06 TaxID=3425126 RepID=UPI003D351780